MNSNEAVVGLMFVVIFVVLSFFAGSSVGKDWQLNDMREAYKACLVAHFEVNGDSEEECSKAQEETSTEFICNQQEKCWLEVK